MQEEKFPCESLGPAVLHTLLPSSSPCRSPSVYCLHHHHHHPPPALPTTLLSAPSPVWTPHFCTRGAGATCHVVELLPLLVALPLELSSSLLLAATIASFMTVPVVFLMIDPIVLLMTGPVLLLMTDPIELLMVGAAAACCGAIHGALTVGLVVRSPFYPWFISKSPFYQS